MFGALLTLMAALQKTNDATLADPFADFGVRQIAVRTPVWERALQRRQQLVGNGGKLELRAFLGASEQLVL
ncbi:MAG: hypothetical protein MRY74_00015 [Neomegalonema sp.]|nr:hypothetical protein [Neomegalonema sp.]